MALQSGLVLLALVLRSDTSRTTPVNSGEGTTWVYLFFMKLYVHYSSSERFKSLFVVEREKGKRTFL